MKSILANYVYLYLRRVHIRAFWDPWWDGNKKLKYAPYSIVLYHYIILYFEVSLYRIAKRNVNDDEE
jgi:hypothetical protein